VPRISEINRNVPPELERIVHRALAADRNDRYSSARELGQDLSRFMFRFAQPVSGYDIATIVQATMRERENARLAQGSFIHKLIEEALFEFNSLHSGEPVLSDAPAAPGGPLDVALLVNTMSPAGVPNVEEGNLAALEDDETRDAPQGTRQRRGPAIAIVVLLALAAASLAWLTGLLR
jgi:serine/threonine-protein kinase